MKDEANYLISETENMYPFERDFYLAMLVEKRKRQEEEKRRANAG